MGCPFSFFLFSIFFIQAKGHGTRSSSQASSPRWQAISRRRQSLAADNLSPQARARMLPVRPIRFRCPSPRPAVCRGSKSVWPGAVRVETLVCAEGARDQMSGDNGEMPPRPARAGAEGEGGGRDGRFCSPLPSVVEEFFSFFLPAVKSVYEEYERRRERSPVEVW